MTQQNEERSAPVVLTVFMLVKTMPEFLGFSVDERLKLLAAHIEPILRKHHPEVTAHLRH